MPHRLRLAGMIGVLGVMSVSAVRSVPAQTPPGGTTQGPQASPSVVQSATAQPAPPATAQANPSPAPAPAAAPLSKEREARLRARVAEYYAARKERDPRAMYNLHEPEYRAKNEYAAYAKATNVRLRFTLLKAEIASIAPQPDDAAVVTMALQMDLDRFGANPVEPADRWVWRDSDWWIAYQDSPLPFPK